MTDAEKLAVAVRALRAIQSIAVDAPKLRTYDDMRVLVSGIDRQATMALGEIDRG